MRLSQYTLTSLHFGLVQLYWMPASIATIRIISTIHIISAIHACSSLLSRSPLSIVYTSNFGGWLTTTTTTRVHAHVFNPLQALGWFLLQKNASASTFRNSFRLSFWTRRLTQVRSAARAPARTAATKRSALPKQTPAQTRRARARGRSGRWFTRTVPRSRRAGPAKQALQVTTTTTTTTKELTHLSAGAAAAAAVPRRWRQRCRMRRGSLGSCF